MFRQRPLKGSGQILSALCFLISPGEAPVEIPDYVFTADLVTSAAVLRCPYGDGNDDAGCEAKNFILVEQR